MADYFSALAKYVQEGDSEAIRPFLVDSNDERKLAIFRNTFIASCIETLKRRFPSCVTVIGDEFFHEISRQYVDKNTPHSKVLADYGETMPSFLEGVLAQQNLDYVADLARLDNTWNQVYFASPTSIPSEQDLARWMENIDSVSLTLSDCTSLVTTQWSVSTLWAMLKEGELSQECEITPEKEYLLMWRDNEGLIRHHSLTHGESIFISNIQQGKTLTEAAENASTIGDIDISTVFSQLIANNLLIEKV